MARSIDWRLLRKEHVAAACKHLLTANASASGKSTGLYVAFEGCRLPAKQVLRVAYCIAAGLSVDTKLKFTSGDSSLNLLRKLGFAADRLDTSERP